MTRPTHRPRRALAAVAAAVGLVIASASAPAEGAPGAPTVGALDAPVKPAVATRLFDPPAQRWLAGHRGVDLAAPAGSAVLAPADGVVAFAGTVVDRGVVSLDHGGGWVTSVEPVDDAPPPGTAVRRGARIGAVAPGGGHCGARGCLHWGVRRHGTYVDPLDVMLGFGPVRLLPVAERW